MAPSRVLPGAGGDHVYVKCCRIPTSEPWIARWAVHTWIDLRRDGVWRRVEVLNASSGVRVRQIQPAAALDDERWGRGVSVVARFGPDDGARRMAADVMRRAPAYPHRDAYRAWPGPNSNTFIRWLSREVDGFAFEMFPNALGEDYGGWFDAGVTTARTGVEVETAVLGFEVGLREGVELHLAGLTLGVGLWPPSLKLPFLPALPWGL